MTVITEAMIDLADCNTTLHYFYQPPETARLPLAVSEKYVNFHHAIAIADAAKLAYDVAAPGEPPVLLKNFLPPYHKNTYRDSFTEGSSLYEYCSKAWEKVMPLAIKLKPRVEFACKYAPDMKISPVPKILIYPFGWSAWFSLRLTGKFAIETLAEFLTFIFETKAFKISNEKNGVSEPDLFTVPALFENFAEGVKKDAFAGRDTKNYRSNNLIVVTTVLSKYHGSVTADCFKEPSSSLLRIVEPVGPPPNNPEEYYGTKRNELEYVLARDDMRFIWHNGLLELTKEKHRIRCYHNNSFLSLVQARHLVNFLDRKKEKTQKNPTAELTDLADHAERLLRKPPYKNAGLKKFLIDNNFLDAPSQDNKKDAESEKK